MLVEIRSGSGDGCYYLNTDLIESIFEREGDTCEIILSNGNRYSSIWSKQKVAEKVNGVLRSTGIVTFDARTSHAPD